MAVQDIDPTGMTDAQFVRAVVKAAREQGIEASFRELMEAVQKEDMENAEGGQSQAQSGGPFGPGQAPEGLL